MHVCAHNTGVWLKHPGRQVRETSFMAGETDLDTNKHRPVSGEKGTSAEKGCLHCCKVKLKKTPPTTTTTDFLLMSTQDTGGPLQRGIHFTFYSTEVTETIIVVIINPSPFVAPFIMNSVHSEAQKGSPLSSLTNNVLSWVQGSQGKHTLPRVQSPPMSPTYISPASHTRHPCSLPASMALKFKSPPQRPVRRHLSSVYSAW